MTRVETRYQLIRQGLAALEQQAKRFSRSSEKERFVRSSTLPREGKPPRQIRKPVGQYRAFLKRTAKVLCRLPRSRSARAFGKGDSNIAHALAHAGEKWRWTLDLRSAFASTGRRRIRRVLNETGLKADLPKRYSKALTYENALPEGYPTSPFLFNAVLAPIDRELEALIKGHDVLYTRYADDLAFSSDREIEHGLREAVMQAFARSGYEMSEEKEQYADPGHPVDITGILVGTSIGVPSRLLVTREDEKAEHGRIEYLSNIEREASKRGFVCEFAVPAV